MISLIFSYLKSKLTAIFLTTSSFIVVYFLLYKLGLSHYSILFSLSVPVFTLIVIFIYDMFKRVLYYNSITKTMNSIKEKTLLTEMIQKSSFFDSEFYYDILKELTKNMNDRISDLELKNKDYKEYIELWVHEIKTPIACANLIVDSNLDNNPICEDIKEELLKIEKYINQSLFYARSDYIEKDYIISKLDLYTLVTSVIKSNSKVFIKNNIKINIPYFEYTVYSDIKWLEFILTQIFDNSIKYMDKDIKQISISAIENSTNVVLCIEDNGCGILKRDIPQLFKKGFTGNSGRIYNKSTGIGLYLCKKLCDSLGLSIEITSKEKEGTNVKITFPKKEII